MMHSPQHRAQPCAHHLASSGAKMLQVHLLEVVSTPAASTSISKFCLSSPCTLMCMQLYLRKMNPSVPIKHGVGEETRRGGGKGRFGARPRQPHHPRGQSASGNLNICHSATWLPPESAICLMLCGNAHGTCFGRVSEQVRAAVHARFESISFPFQDFIHIKI